MKRVTVHLRPLERAGQLDMWSDARLKTGDNWRAAIHDAIERAAVAVVLVSADFLASEFIASEELPKLLEAAKRKGVKILPVIVGACRFSREETLAQFQAINDPTNPLSLMNPSEQDVVLDQLAAQIEMVVGIRRAS